MEARERFIRNISVPHEEENGMTRYELQVLETHKDDKNKIRVVDIGRQNKKPFKGVLLLGETGSGKTQLINVFVNHLFNIDVKDHFRVFLDDPLTESKSEIESKTEYITSYRIYSGDGIKCDTNIMFIDTPGFRDTNETTDESLVERLNTFFLGKFEVNFLHSIGIVCKANQNRNVEYFKEIIHDTVHLLGKDCKRIIHVFCSFAYDETPVLKVLEDCGLIFEKAYKFESSKLYTSNNLMLNLLDDDIRDQERNWEKMQRECSKFLNDLKSSSPVNVENTRKLHTKIKELKIIEEQLRAAADRLSNLRRNLKEIWEKITTKVYEVQERPDIKLDAGEHAHYCRNCNQTCGPVCKDPNVLKNILVATINIGLPIAATVLGTNCMGLESDVAKGVFGALATTVGSFDILQLAKGNCPLNSDKTCNINGCDHRLSEHEKSMEKILTISEEAKEIAATVTELHKEFKRASDQYKKLEVETNEILTQLQDVTKEMLDLSLHTSTLEVEVIMDKLKDRSSDVFYQTVVHDFIEKIKSQTAS